ncbi:helix-turn-helix domain-containing protein [Sulfitobacter sp. S190]|uniref:helix-turn-helix domain-containing protein n=1 Tax=Sulfitobacter sp. S190 TaxID=2867022 RepID=UPI0021A4A068|nr:helix-turn-helix domain-containing protein [Sulfitobacter sp. S190]UWR21076.1 helix-turn-helix domain-containing protein [Sulfitobacter sp. S190]
MAREGLTGSRIRERRGVLGYKQADLARRIGISASYLNLIEHNRRRIGGKLLLDIAAQLQVEPQALTEGAEAALLGHLREAAVASDLSQDEAARADEFAGRFPGWAEALAESQRRIATLERTVETLSDRMTHDPHLAASMHELLTTVSAIRSTAEILAQTKTLEPEWRDRFHTNIDADSRRLADSAQALVQYLELEQETEDTARSAQEEVEHFLDTHGYHFDTLEEGGSAQAVEALLQAEAPRMSATGRYILGGVLTQVAQDARLLPMAALRGALEPGQAPDPVALARWLRVPVPVVLRRLAAVAEMGAGLVVCDRSGTVIFRKPVDGFSVPRFGACCPLWPLFGALAGGGMVLRERVGQLGRDQTRFDAVAVADTQGGARYNAPPMMQGVMLLLPVPVGDTALPARDVGATCRICPHASCAARRELSILSA